MGAAEGSVWLAYVLEPLGQDAGPGAAKKRGVGWAALTSEHYVRLPLSARGLSEEKKPPPKTPPLVYSFPSFLGAPFPLADPGRAKLVPGRNFPSGLSQPPHTLPPPKSWVQCLLYHSNASNEGASRRPQCGPVGHWEGSCLLSPALTFTGREEGFPGQAGPLVPPLRVSEVSDCVHVAFFCL